MFFTNVFCIFLKKSCLQKIIYICWEVTLIYFKNAMYSHLQEVLVVLVETAFNPLTLKMLADLNYISRYHYEVDTSIFA